MSSIQQIKLTQYIKNQKETVKAIARSIAALNNDLAAALEHQAYARQDPDLIIGAELLAILNYDTDELLTKYAEIDAKRLDIIAVKDNVNPVEYNITKYNIDLVKYSNGLL